MTRYNDPAGCSRCPRPNDRLPLKSCSLCAAKAKEYYDDNHVEISKTSKACRKANPEKHRTREEAYRRTHRKERSTYSNNYYYAHYEEVSAKQAAYRERNREKIRQYDKAYREAHKEERAEAARAYHKTHRKEVNARQVRRAHNDLQFRLRKNLRGRLSSAIRKNSKAGSAVRDLGCTIPELKAYLEGLWQPGMDWSNWSRAGWHIDHIKPLDAFDLTDRKQCLEACHYTNLQPMWAKENCSKGPR
jgi:hypothetical protein